MARSGDEYRIATELPLVTNPVYVIKKSLIEVGLDGGIRFNKKDEIKYMFEKFDWEDITDMRIIETWDTEYEVIDDDTKTTHMLRLQKKPGRPWGFFEDWYEKVALPRKFKGDEVIGFYIDPCTNFHFKVLGTDKGKGKEKGKISCCKLLFRGSLKVMK